MDKAEEQLDLWAEHESQYFALQKELQDHITTGLAELSQAKLTNSALESELQVCNFRSPAAHYKALVSPETVDLVGTTPRPSDLFGISTNPHLHRSQGQFISALQTIARLIHLQKTVKRLKN